jgi:hypothetical protein
MIKKLLLCASLVLGLLGLISCSMLSHEKSVASPHPQALGQGRPMCTECHENEPMKDTLKLYSSFNHTPDFVQNHKFLANQDSATCAACHSQASCSECHAGKGVLNPSVKLADRPDRVSPHRGDYLSLHRVEGRIDPTSCFKCHGRANNRTCTACHK